MSPYSTNKMIHRTKKSSIKRTDAYFVIILNISDDTSQISKSSTWIDRFPTEIIFEILLVGRTITSIAH
jgi:hypothetical protein